MTTRGLLSLAALSVAVAWLAAVRPGATGVTGAMAPPFPSARPADWIGPPATWQDLRGRVVLLDVWTFG
jgi:hypothetical protein